VIAPVAAVCLRDAGGSVLELPAHRWVAPADPVEEELLARVRGPVLDVGCGPGRHLVALRERGVFALGIDVSPSFVAIARSCHVNVLERSVFDAIPGAGRWAAALLLDGNVGIGGDPVALLARLAALLRPDARVIVEHEADDYSDGGGHDVRLVRAETENATGPWFRWTTVGPTRLEAAARSSGWRVHERHDPGDRCFAELVRR
jgi:SAM-dependent methyltransferase